MDSRYEGRPFLRLLECFVLDSIGLLPVSDKNKLQVMTPKLQTVYKVNGDWRRIIRTVMRLPDNVDEKIRVRWEYDQNAAFQKGENLLPEDFARKLVDECLLTDDTHP